MVLLQLILLCCGVNGLVEKEERAAKLEDPKSSSLESVDANTLLEKLLELTEKNAQLRVQVEKLRGQVAERDKALLILRVRSRIEELENKFLNKSMKSDSRYNKWNEILFAPEKTLRKSAELTQFRSLIVNQTALIETIQDLYGDFSDIAAHEILFPISYNRTSIEQMFHDVGLIPDISKIDAVEILLTPIPRP